MNEFEDFQILPSFQTLKLSPINFLPEWIQKALKFSNDPNFKLELGDENLQNILNQKILDNIKFNNIFHLFPVQYTLFNVIKPTIYNLMTYLWKRPSDICVRAPTGSGKTLAYILPIIQDLYLSYNNWCLSKEIRAIVLVPTKDLAKQVFEEFKKFLKGLDLEVIIISGDKNFEEEKKQFYKTRNDVNNFLSGNAHCQHTVINPDILIATPGRLVEHIYNNPHFSLNNLKYFVIDEADRILQDIKHDWIFHYNNFTKSYKSLWPPRKILLSATFSYNPEKLAELQLYFPIMLEGSLNTSHKDMKDSNKVSKYILPPTLKQYHIVCPTKSDKPLYLMACLANLSKYFISNHDESNVSSSNNILRILCFTKSVESGNRLTKLLNMSNLLEYQAIEFNSRRNKEQAQKLLKKFHSQIIPCKQATPTDQFKISGVKILICSDVMARGMDLASSKNLSPANSKSIDMGVVVINYDAPLKMKNYVHRVGRTARAGLPGTAITFIEESQLQYFISMFTKSGFDKSMSVDVHEQTAHFEKNCPPLSVMLTGLDSTFKTELETLQPNYHIGLKKLKRYVKTTEVLSRKRLKTFK